NIGGQLFNIDEDALRRLEEYFNRLRGYFGGNGEASEMLADVEARIAELLGPLSKGSERVVDLAAIESVISQMGEPEEWGTPDEETPGSGSTTKHTRSRRIFRDPDRRLLGGVASGLAAWSGLDPMVVRVLFILFSVFYFTGLIVYAVLWLVLPEAHTTSEKLEMHGEEVNVDNLKRRFNEEKQRLAELGEKLPKNEDVRRFTHDFGQGLGRMIHFGLNLFLRMIGVIILLSVLALSISLSVAMFVRDTVYLDGSLRFMNLNFIQISQYLIPQESLRWQLYLAVAVSSVALLGLLTYWGLKLLIQWKNSTWQLPSILGLMLAGGLVLGAVFGFRYQEQTRVNKVKTYEYSLGKVAGPKLEINIENRGYSEMQVQPGILLSSGKNAAGGEDFFTKDVSYRIKQSPSDSMFINILARAKGKSEDGAFRNLQGICYNWKASDSVLVLDSRFSVPLEQGFYHQDLEVVIYVPLSKQVYISRDDTYEFDYSSFADGFDRDAGWFKMTRAGLYPVSDTLTTKVTEGQ
ncbi:MAG: hypothetical protein CVU06_10375, partial [Bacteroidetes bacterium HGW-Bacteroidetes-22]